jgi:hypothetical protein
MFILKDRWGNDIIEMLELFSAFSALRRYAKHGCKFRLKGCGTTRVYAFYRCVATVRNFLTARKTF